MKRTTSLATGAEDLLHMQDLMLMQQGQGLDFSNREQRFRSRDRLQEFFQGLQRVLKPDMTLEIGAHAAPFSQKMALIGIEAHAFEANPYNYQAFAARLGAEAPDVRYHHLAMNDADGEVTFQVKETKAGKAVNKVAGNNSLLMRTDDAFTYESVTVPATRLDSYLAANDLQERSFSAWIDVEGALGRVTAGFGTALRSCLSLIVEVEEVSYWQGQMLVLDAMRYFAGQGMVPIARDFEAKHQYNLVYLRADQLAQPAVRLALANYLHGR